MTKRIAITPGEPAGIGPDLTIAIAQQDWPVELVVVACPELMMARAEQIGLPLTLVDYDASKPASAQKLVRSLFVR